jgi:hypothetical protein
MHCTHFRRLIHSLAFVAVPLVADAGYSSLSAQLVTFDDLPATTGVRLPASYARAGTNWGNFYYATQTASSDIVCRSASNCAYNFGGGAITVSSTTSFTFSGYIRRLTLGSSPASTVTIEGLLGGAVVSSQTVTLSSSYQLFTLAMSVDAVRFTPTGPTAAACGSTAPITACYFSVDDLTFGTVGDPGVVPEPATWLLTGTGLFAVAVGGARRRAAVRAHQS